MNKHPFITGGPVPFDSTAYLLRNADVKARQLVENMEYITIIEPRQQGKTSLIHRLKQTMGPSYELVYINALTLDKSSEALWYTSLCDQLFSEIEFLLPGLDAQQVCTATSWYKFLLKLALQVQRTGCYFVIALDEVGDMELDWCKPFFSTLRAIFDMRSSKTRFRHISFILAGVYSPHKLVFGSNTSPFNVAQMVRLADFTLELTRQLTAQLTVSSEGALAIAQSIQYWTDGQPYLTQRLCRSLAEGEAPMSPIGVDYLVSRLYHDDSNHLPHVLNALEKNSKLGDYVQKVQAGYRPNFRPATESLYHGPLHLIGILKADERGDAKIRNLIYDEALQNLNGRSALPSPTTTPPNKSLPLEVGHIEPGLQVTFTWLHLSDLHLGMNGSSELWPNVEETFFNDLEYLHEKVGPWDLVLFTGDFTQRGLTDEYTQVSRLLEKFWDRFDVMGFQPKLLAVPGNHDLVREKDEGNPTLLNLTHLWNNPRVQESFWNSPKSPQRKLISRAFANYSKWWAELPKHMKPETYSFGMLAGDFSATLEKESVKLGIVGLNSTFLQLVGGDREGKLALDIRQFNAACANNGPEWLNRHNVCLLMTHQPPDWLTEQARESLDGEIHNPPRRFALHMFGHMHHPKLSSLAEGGSDARHRLQGCSLFGLEKWGDNKTERLHGYSLCQLKIDEHGGKLRIWPRRAEKKQDGGWEIDRDPRFRLNKDDGGTEPVDVKLVRSQIRQPFV